MTLARPLLWSVMLLSAVLIAVRFWVGSYFLVRSPMNAEGAFALAAVLLLACSRGSDLQPQPELFSIRWSIAAALAVVFAAYWPSLRLPLLFDDYPHLLSVLRHRPEFWKEQFTIPSPNGFFRPIGMYAYGIDAVWAGHDPFLWRFGNLLLHSANCLMVFLLARRLGLASRTAVFAAMLFGVHGSRMESAGWVAGRFDLLAALFVLAGLLLLYRYHDRSSTWLLAAAHAMCLLGLLSKESAYVFPVLATILFWRKLSPRVLASLYVLTALVFAYRWWLLGGIGGYRTAGGEPMIFLLSITRSLKALFWRLWATLWFPINWSHTPSWPLALAATAMLAMCVWVFWKRPAIHWEALAFTFVAAIPVQHLLLIGPDLNGARVLYLPSIGFAILVAFALQSVPQLRVTAVAALAILVFHLAALDDNLRFWARASYASEAACRQVGDAMLKTGKEATASDLPRTLDGVFFLQNGFEACVEWNSGVPADSVHVPYTAEAPTDNGDRLLFRWDAERGMVRVH